MTEVAVCQSVRTNLEPDDDGMYFRNGANERMMDSAIHGDTCDEEATGCIDAMDPSNNKPYGPEVFSSLCAIWRILGIPLGTTKRTLGLVCGGKLNDVGDKEMTRNQQVENKAKNDVLSTIIMATDTYENSILYIMLGSQNQSMNLTSFTFMKFSMTSRRFITTVSALD